MLFCRVLLVSASPLLLYSAIVLFVSVVTVAWMLPIPEGPSGRGNVYERTRWSPAAIGPLLAAAGSLTTTRRSDQAPPVALLPVLLTLQLTVNVLSDCKPDDDAKIR